MTESIWIPRACIRVLALAAVVSPLCSLAARAADVRGVVADQGDFPLYPATVVLRSLSDSTVVFTAKTKGDGSYFVTDVPFGEYSIQASAPGFVSVRYEPVHIEYPRLTWDFKLPLARGTEGGVYSAAELIGTLRTGDRRHGGATVCLSNRDRSRCVTANRIGEYQMSIEPGKYTATVTEKGDVLWQQEVDLPQVGEYRDYIKR
jgi:hypothetical protein